MRETEATPEHGENEEPEGPRRAAELTAALHEILADHDVGDPRLEVEIDRLLGRHGPAVYAELIRLLCHLRVDDHEAEAHWQEMHEHRAVLGRDRGSTIDLRIALVSYFLHVQHRYRNPTILELDAFHRTQASAYRDALTGLHNYRSFRERLECELQRSEHNLAPLSLVMVDVDGFKAYNDAHGHQAANDVLVEVAATLLHSLRRTDLVARYGGEEFGVILPETMRIRVHDVAERLRDAIASRRFGGERTSSGRELTASLGVATYPADARTSRDLVSAADRAVYEAKSGGKNRVCLYGEDPRSYARRAVAVSGALHIVGGESQPVRTIDVSEGGARIVTERPVDRGTPVELRLAVPASDRHVALLGRVVDHEPDTTGRVQLAVQTMHMEREDRDQLVRFLRDASLRGPVPG